MSLLSVEQAKEVLLEAIQRGPVCELPLSECHGYVLASDLSAPLALPPFDQSAMDGYALRFSDVELGKRSGLKVAFEIKAGEYSQRTVQAGEAARIFTGAPIPTGADTVIMQEYVNCRQFQCKKSDCNKVHSEITIESGLTVVKGAHIRKEGDQIHKSQQALTQGAVLGPAGVGFMAALGYAHLPVFQKPRISIIVTGSELREPGTELGPGQIYESNSMALQAALESVGFQVKDISVVEDDKAKLSEAIENAFKTSNTIILSGGVSVGEYDLVRGVLEQLGTEEVLYKVAQKPGKPLYVGKHSRGIVFGLPGNPASMLVCFYEYVYPALRKMAGYSDLFLQSQEAKLLGDVVKKKGRSSFLKGALQKEGVQPLGGQESFVMQSFANANVLIYVPAEVSNLSAGEKVAVHILPV